jgi:hypothetical protein
MEVLNMAKKIIMGVLFLGLVGALAVGAVNRTVAKSADTNNTEQRGAGWAARAQEDGTVLAANVEGRGGRNQATTDETHAAGQGGQGQRTPLNTQQGGGRNSQAAGGQGNQARGNGTQVSTLPAQAVEGIVLSIDDSQMTLLTEQGEVELADRAWRFALEQGFMAEVGQRVRVSGYDEDGAFAAAQMLNISTQQQVEVRAQSGQPLWSGGGQGGQGGQGQADAPQGDPQVLAATEDHQWTTVSGVVRSIDDAQMTIQTESGDIVIADRPWSFALEAGFTAQLGDQVTMQGFYEGETFEAGQLANGDLVVSIREESGRPLWAGGRGGGQGRSG